MISYDDYPQYLKEVGVSDTEIDYVFREDREHYILLEDVYYNGV